MKKIITLIVAMVIAVICFSYCNAQSMAKFVDLGLPSGTLWADRNVGASSPEDYGDYFAWGETTTKSTYEWLNYKYVKGNHNDRFTKYCSKSDFGNRRYTDRLTTLESSDDAATANWGSNWCMPTRQQFQELKDNCTWTWTTRNGKSGYEVKGKNGNSIFLPAADNIINTDLSDAGVFGYYWSSSLATDKPSFARCLCFESDSVIPGSVFARRCGLSVRPVRCK